MVEGGAWDIELTALLKVLVAYGLGAACLHTYSQKSQWPKGYAHGRDICKSIMDKRAKPTEPDPNGSASEMISSAPVIGKWLADVVQPRCIEPLKVHSALLCITVLDLIMHTVTGDVTPDALADAILAYAIAHLAAHGTELWTPKFHCLFHLPAQLKQCSLLLACFVHERKHKIAKRWAAPLNSKKQYEMTILEECTYAHMRGLWIHC